MEHWGTNQDFVQSAIHTPSSFGNTVNKGGRVISNASTEFHIYEMEWLEEEIRFSIDGILHYTYDPSVLNADTWPFVAPQYILLNVAILPSIDPAFTESAMEIDYVRVYQEATLGITDTDLSEAIFFPNPAKDRLTVTLDTQWNGGSIELRTLTGQLIDTVRIDGEQTQLNLKQLQEGTYILGIKKNDKALYRVILKK